MVAQMRLASESTTTTGLSASKRAFLVVHDANVAREVILLAEASETAGYLTRERALVYMLDVVE